MDNFITGSSINLSSKNPETPAAKASVASIGNAQGPSVSISAAAPQVKITGVKTFFAKLHAGSLSFLDEQIISWLKDNPDIIIKNTNVVVGDITAKNTEPNVIIILWY